MSVEYRDIPGFPVYRVGNDGTVWSCLTRKGLGGRKGSVTVIGSHWSELVGSLDKDGYRKLILCAAGRRRTARVNILVLEVFVGPPPPGTVSAHGNGVRTDNRLSNLRCATQQSNVADKLLHGTHQCGERNGNCLLTESAVKEMRRRRAAGESIASLSAAFNVSQPTVSAICCRRLWKHVT